MRISIVILNYGNPDLALECLASIEQVDHRSHIEIILVDNGSEAGERSRLHDGVQAGAIRLEHFVQLPENIGFSRGMNAGIALAAGDFVIALNPDTLVGQRVPTMLLRENPSAAERPSFFAVPVFDAETSAKGMVKTDRLQGHFTALTWYISCMPVRSGTVRPEYVLGPPGPAVIMTRALIREMMARYGFVYDPAFFLYGEDVDLFLRARRAGFHTQVLDGRLEHEEVIWHVGSAASSKAGVRTIDKSPEVAGRVLAGCLRNAWSHAGRLELLPVLLLQLCFRISFCALYARRHSWRSLGQLIPAAKAANRHPRRDLRTSDAFLFPLIALLYRRPFPWARARSQPLEHTEPTRLVEVP